MADEITFLAACDDNFFGHMRTMITSVGLTHKKSHFYVAAIEVDAQKQAEFMASVAPLGVTLEYINFSRSEFDGLKATKGLPSAVWGRLLALQRLPSKVERVIYVDCDVLVFRCLKTVFEADLNGCVAGMVEDMSSGPALAERKSDLGLLEDDTYFNTGVMVVDVPRWQREDVSAEIMKFARANPDRLRLGDQCATNAVLKRRITPLNRGFNHSPLSELIDHAMPSLVHFMGRKPWSPKPGVGGAAYQMIRRVWDPNYRLPRGSQFRATLRMVRFYLWRRFISPNSVRRPLDGWRNFSYALMLDRHMTRWAKKLVQQ
ncbi:MAG: glycosyltransferase family 8 protein [Pseudomonadota bacterium]